MGADYDEGSLAESQKSKDAIDRAKGVIRKNSGPDNTPKRTQHVNLAGGPRLKAGSIGGNSLESRSQLH